MCNNMKHLPGVAGKVMLYTVSSAACAARILAIFLFRPDPSNILPSRLTDITKVLQWLCPVSETTSYLIPGRISFRRDTGFLPATEAVSPGLCDDVESSASISGEESRGVSPAAGELLSFFG